MAEGDIEGEEKENFHFSLQHLEILSYNTTELFPTQVRHGSFHVKDIIERIIQIEKTRNMPSEF